MTWEKLPPDQKAIAGAEDVKDSFRVEIDNSDTPQERAAKRYLISRARRLDMEFEMQSRIDSLPYRLVELFRARKFARASDVTFNTRQQMDEMLPSLARLTVEKTKPVE